MALGSHAGLVVAAFCLGAVSSRAQLATPAMLRPADGVSIPLLRASQDALIADARRDWNARPPRFLPGFEVSLRHAQRASGLAWTGLPPVVLIVPDEGRGFRCDEGYCQGRFLGARIRATAGDSSAALSSIILVAESAALRADVWEHELTHALLAQHGLLAESERHDPRYFRQR